MKQLVFRIIAQYWHMIVLLSVIQASCGFLLALQPRYYQKIVSIIIENAGVAILSEGLRVVVILAFIYIVGATLQGISGYIGVVFSSKLLERLQISFFEKTNQLPLQFFQRQSTGEFFTKFNNDVGQVQFFFASFIPSTLHELIAAVTVVGILFYFCPVILTCTALVIILLTSFLVVLINKIMAKYARAQRAGWSEVNRLFDEIVQGIETIKMFGVENEHCKLFQKRASSFRTISVRAGSIVSIFSPSIDTILKLGSLFLIFFAYHMIYQKNISLDPFLLFFFYITLLQATVSNLFGSLTNIQNSLTGIHNLSNFFAEFSEKDESKITSAKIEKSVSIAIEGLAFAYPGGKTLFNDLNLFIPANCVTVIQGPNGSGKSTLINLLLKFYFPIKGTIHFGGIDINKLTRKELRQKISVVTQYHHIFHDSLKANLLIAKPDANDEEVMNTLKKVYLEDLVRRLPKGINEVLHPRGKGLSGGEKQRICIARLLLRNSPIMVLDEPWSNLDKEARNTLTEVLNSFKKQSTIIILTHENIPLLEVDRAFYLDK